MAHGPDSETFQGYEANPVLDPRTGCNEVQIHGGMVQPYEGVYIGLYQHWEGEDWNIDLRLAVSRDGIHFTRIQPHRPVLPRGPEGSWDSGMLCTPASFFTRGDQIWLYYLGTIGTLATGRAVLEASEEAPERRETEIWRMMTGLARFRRDGFAYLTLPKPRQLPQPEQHKTVPKYRLPMRGTLRTIPIDAAGITERELHLNVENFAPGLARVTVEIIDATSGDAIEGHRHEDCDPVDESSIDHTVTWRNSSSLGGIEATRIRVEYCLYGTLNSPQLYSTWFETA
jgi:hypothetical protein